jgi:hypothetical protein
VKKREKNVGENKTKQDLKKIKKAYILPLIWQQD